MPQNQTVFFRFTKGELDPVLDGRSDLDVYYSSAKTMENCIPLPQGGVRRRPGLQYTLTAPNEITIYPFGSVTATAPQGGTAGNVTDGDLTTFLVTTNNISTTDPYVVCTLDLGSAQNVAFLDLALVSLTSGSTPVSTEFQIQSSDDDITYVSLPDYQSSFNSIYLDSTARNYRIQVGVTARYFRLARIGATDLGTARCSIAEATFWTDDATQGNTRLAQFDFSDSNSYVLLFTDNNIAIIDNATESLVTNVYSPYTSDQLSVEDNNDVFTYDQQLNIAVFCHPEVAPYQLVFFPVSDASVDYIWSMTEITFTNIPKWQYSLTTTNPAATLAPSAADDRVTLTAGAAVLGSVTVGMKILVNGGQVRVTELVSATVVIGYAEIPLVSTTTAASGAWSVETGWEDLWSSTRGYPRAVAFFQQRLVLGGFESAPNVIAASVLNNDYYNFNQGIQNDSDGFIYQLDGGNAIVIYHLYGHNTLEIFTNESEFTLKVDNAFTASQAAFQRQSQIGSRKYLAPVEIQNGGTLFVQKSGKGLGEFVYEFQTNSYTTRPTSILSEHLINSPTDSTILYSNDTRGGSYWAHVNEDGQLVIACFLTLEQVIAFTKHTTTSGIFVNVQAVNGKLWMVVKRTILGQDYYYLEQFDFDAVLDSELLMTAADTRISGLTISGLDHLDGQEVWSVVDGNAYGPFTVQSGEITLVGPETITEYVETGLLYNMTLVTNALEAPQNAPALMGHMKSISQITINVFETQDVLVQGYSPMYRVLSSNTTSNITIDETPPAITGRLDMKGFLGWNATGNITITTRYPLNCTVLNLIAIFNYGN